MSQLVGATFAGRSGRRYAVLDEIGEGGTARVFRVSDGNGRLLAAKVLSDHRFPIDDAMRARFGREIDHLSRIDHPRVLRVEDVGAHEGEPVLVCELAAQSLHSRLEGWHGAMPLPVLLTWLEQALDGVAAMHAIGLVHRDLSPKNLLLREDGSLLVADFGTVRHLHDSTITHMEAVMGSLLYISRQQFEDAHAADSRDDVFSLGQIAWQLLSSYRPIGNVPPITEVRHDLPAGLGALVEDMRADEPDRRPINAAAALERLRSVVEGHRRDALRPGGSSELEVAVLAIGRRQQEHLAAAAQDERLRRPARALERIVNQLGPVRLDPAGFGQSARQPPADLPVAISDGLYSALDEGSLHFHYDAFASDAGDGWLLTFTNAVTGRAATMADSSTQVASHLNLDSVLEDLELLVALPGQLREKLIGPLTAPGFLHGRDCPDCGQPLLLQHRPATGRFSGQGLFQAATCPNDDPAEPYRCCVCGTHFLPVSDYDEHGRFDSTGCECRSGLAVEFAGHPWREGRPLVESDVTRVFE